MAEIFNLRLARKARARTEASRTAEANRAKFGQTKAERSKHKQDTERARKLLDGAKREQD